MVRRSNDQFNESMRQGRPEREVRPWGFEIVPDNPLRFVPTLVKDLPVRIDMFMKVLWNEDPAQEPCYLTSVMRVWALNPNLYFRCDWDAAHLKNRIVESRGRVMLRVHFDLANDGQTGPRHHLQFGGTQHADEWHWFPDSLTVPRLPHTPMDIVLLAELIAATFYPDDYMKIRSEPAWKREMRASQSHYLRSYLETAKNALESEVSVLESLWNFDWE